VPQFLIFEKNQAALTKSAGLEAESKALRITSKRLSSSAQNPLEFFGFLGFQRNQQESCACQADG
jgi:hypothetical protein